MADFFIIIVIITILVALGLGLICILNAGRRGSDTLFKSLVASISLSLFLFLLVLFAVYSGWIEPNPLVFSTSIQIYLITIAEFFIFIVIITILVALGIVLKGMLTGSRRGCDRMFISLVARISLSVIFILLVLFPAFMDWIEPNTSVVSPL